MLTDEEKIEYSLEREKPIFRDRYGKLLVKLSNNIIAMVITDVFFTYDKDNNEYELCYFEDNSKFTILTNDDEYENTDINLEIVDVIDFIDVLI